MTPSRRSATAEIALLDGERLATAAWLAGAPYPVASLDKAWRLLAFGAHHDAITGTEGDQVYLDLLAGWREAYERGAAARADAASYLAGQADTAAAAGQAPAPDQAGPRAIVVFNTLAWPRSGLATITLEFAAAKCAAVRLTDQAGTQIRYLADGVTRHQDGSLAAATLTFLAGDIPPLGYKTFLAHPVPPGQDAPAPEASAWQAGADLVIENGAFTVRAGGADDGSLESIVDRRSGTELLAGAGNELVIQEEYPTHPRWGEGPWLLCQKGRWRGPADRHAKVRAERCPIGSRLVTEYAFDDLQVTQETLLWDGSDVIEFRTHVDGSIGHDRLLRVRFATNVPGGLPIYQTGLSVIGRPFGDAEIDVAEHTYTLDNPAHEWFGVGSTARVSLTGQAGERRLHAIGVAEVIAPADAATDGFAPRDTGAGSDCRDEVRALLVALAKQGVTATCSVPEGPRYGVAELDSNLPDVRIALGGPDKNDFTAQVLAAAGPAVTGSFESQMAETGSARIWVPAARGRSDAFVPSADLRGSADLPVLIVAGTDLPAAIAAVAEDLADAQIEAPWSDYSWSDEPGLASHAVALLNRGLPGSIVTPAGDACISLMRACSAWPSGTWMDGERRTLPDGSSFAWQHWSHTFEYALASGSGDWRTAGFPVTGQEYSHRLLTCETDLHDGPLPAVTSLISVTPAGVDVMALKPRGNPIAPLAQPDPADGVTIRLRDLAGRNGRTTAGVRLFTGVSEASVTSLLEDSERQPAGRRDGTVTAVVPERGTVTLAVRPDQIRPAARLRITRHCAARAGAAGLHQVLAAWQGTGASGKPAGRGALVARQAGRPARCRGMDQGQRRVRASARRRHGPARGPRRADARLGGAGDTGRRPGGGGPGRRARQAAVPADWRRLRRLGRPGTGAGVGCRGAALRRGAADRRRGTGTRGRGRGRGRRARTARRR